MKADASPTAVGSIVSNEGLRLPPPDMTMPSIVEDGPQGAHYYRESTVRELLAQERARCQHRQAKAVVRSVQPGEDGVKVRWLGGFPQVGDKLY